MMGLQDVQQMISDYANWIETEISVSEYGEYFELTTPYLDRFNDYLQIYIKQEENGTILMTDDGYVIGNLSSSGMTFRAGSKRKKTLDRIIRNYSLQLGGDEIWTSATARNFPQKKHMMVQAMLAIDDMFETSKENVANLFVEDVQNFFDQNKIYYSKDFSILGKTGSINTYEFHFQRTQKRPERFCKVLNKLRKDNRDLAIFNWIDTKNRRDEKSELIIMLNDQHNIQGYDIEALESYDIKPIFFSERKKHLELFSA